jgi:hypothetical protein
MIFSLEVKDYKRDGRSRNGRGKKGGQPVVSKNVFFKMPCPLPSGLDTLLPSFNALYLSALNPKCTVFLSVITQVAFYFRSPLYPVSLRLCVALISSFSNPRNSDYFYEYIERRVFSEMGFGCDFLLPLNSFLPPFFVLLLGRMSSFAIHVFE